MATNLQNARDFQRRLGDLAVRVEAGGARAVRRAALAIDQTLVLATPVDTGRARANWIASINVPADGVDEFFTPPAARTKEAHEAAASVNTSRALEQAQAVINAARGPTRGAGGRFQTPSIWLTNNLPYIDALNRGSSPQQAGGHFVELAVKAGAETVRGVRLLEAA